MDPKVLARRVLAALFCTLGACAHAMSILVITPHPDDAEASCGGLIANATARGDTATVLTMTGGERGIGGKGPDEARQIRAREARAAAAVLGAQLRFLGESDGALVADAGTQAKLTAVLRELRPDLVLAPWPLDVHPDHQASGMLAWRAFQDTQFSFELYFYETANLPHTRSFRFDPTDYVDVTAVMARKREATLQHKSQDPEAWFPQYANLAQARGGEADTAYAEAYLRARNSSGLGGRGAATAGVLPSMLGR